ncbi:MAG: bifunctional phosphoribosylaminoimidazolecarboxamide formyltransferase/IMP cyclohydrolase [Phycisphaerae bacterium]
MSCRPIKRAVISTYDKTGVPDLARALVEEFGIEIISTGGTARLLNKSGVPVTPVESVTGFREMLDGRVKTLHPRIHAAILADRDNPEHMRQLEENGIPPIDMVVVNLYPFEQAVAETGCSFERAIEMIDIGGPCLLRAAAKNHRHVVVIPDVDTGRRVLEAMRCGEVSSQVRLEAAHRAYELTGLYDDAISEWLGRRPAASRTARRHIRLLRLAGLRYGENPHQEADVYRVLGESSDEPTLAQLDDQLAASAAMSFNNYLDGAAALELCKELYRGFSPAGSTADGEPQLATCVFVKHTNPCGVGIAGDALEAYRCAYLGDANAAMGGILACSFEVDHDFALAVMETYSRWGRGAGAGGFFVEVWIAPGFSEAALEVIRTSREWGKRVRLLSVGRLGRLPDPKLGDYRGITGGMLVQTRDSVGLNDDDWQVVTRRSPTDSEMVNLRLAWLVCKHTKSNAVTICSDNMLIGNGGGQTSRVMSCRIATWLAKDNGHTERLTGAAAASDAFFPFADGPSLLMDAGVTAIIQPGGSKRDDDTIKACDDRGATMVFTGMRHFKH